MGKIESPSIFRSGEKGEQLRKRLTDALDSLEEEDRIITEDEVSDAVAKAIGYKAKQLNKIFSKARPRHCSQCGAPLKDGKCEYCGTDYN